MRRTKIIATLGPATDKPDILEKLIKNVSKLNFMYGNDFDFDNEKIFVTRSGYTGEDGFEISISNQKVNDLVNKLLDLNSSEMFILSSLALASILFGFYPDPLLSTTSSSVEGLIDLFNTNIKIYTASNL